MRKHALVLAVVGLVALAGCSMVGDTPGPNNPSADNVNKTAVLQDAAGNFQSANTFSSSTDATINFSIRSQNFTLNQTIIQRMQTQHNRTTSNFHTTGEITTVRGNNSRTQTVDVYYVDGIIYSYLPNQDSYIKVQNATPQINSTFNMSVFAANADKFTVTTNGSTYIFTADLTKKENFTALTQNNATQLTGTSFQEFGQHAETFTLTIKVNSETRQVKSVSIDMYAEVTKEEMNASNQSQFSMANKIIINASATQTYSNYNNTVTITPPENVTESQE